MVAARTLIMVPLFLVALLLRRTESIRRAGSWSSFMSVPSRDLSEDFKDYLENHRGSRPDGSDEEQSQNITNITAQLGAAAFLPCQHSERLDHLAEVSWLRRQNWELLTSGKAVFTSDNRFHVFHDPVSNVWVLKISFVQLADSGLYECQVAARSGKLSRLVWLHVVRPVVDIQGTSAYHVERGSSIRLVCNVRQQVTAWPLLVAWHRNFTVLNPYKLRQDMQINVRRKHGGRLTSSTLSIGDARTSDSGNYTCSADNARPASVTVFVSQVDNTAAIQRWKAVTEAATAHAENIRPARHAGLIAGALLLSHALSSLIHGTLPR